MYVSVKRPADRLVTIFELELARLDMWNTNKKAVRSQISRAFKLLREKINQEFLK